MYRRGQGVARNPIRSFMWFSFAAARGDARARMALGEVSQTMTREEISQAREVARACKASNYRSCEY
jgi:TPR repeat protein